MSPVAVEMIAQLSHCFEFEIFLWILNRLQDFLPLFPGYVPELNV